MTSLILWFHEIDEASSARVGGKGLNLGLMTAAQLPVPNGFVITHDAYRVARERECLSIDESLRTDILAHYTLLGRGLVAVRSSATSEDGTTASFAGQQETILGVKNEAELLDAVVRCWQSLHTERATAYRAQHGIDDRAATMAVVVQGLVEAEVAGVLFTQDPFDASGKSLLVEAAPGIGEAVVSGRVTPDRFQVDRTTGEVLKQVVSEKRELLTATGWQPIAANDQSKPCLAAPQLADLAVIAARIEKFYGGPRDVEWAYADGQFAVLQARPITAGGASEIEAVRKREIENARALSTGRDTIWGRFNLAEVLPTPLPLTWSIVREFMSGKGGYGRMFRALGYDPDPELDDAGFVDLIGGRPYINLDREPKLYFRDFPYGYDFAAIRREPALALSPKLVAVPARKTSRFWWRLPSIAWAMLRATSRIKTLMASDAERLEREVYPNFVKQVYTDEAKNVLASLAYEQLFALSNTWRERINDFAVDSLRPGVFAATALAELEQALTAANVQNPASAARQLVMGTRPPRECDLAGGLRDVSQRVMSVEEFLSLFGHRGPAEMELSQPRYRDTPEKIESLRNNGAIHLHPQPHAESEFLNRDAALATRLQPLLSRTNKYTALRESSKHYLMLGFARLREIFREMGRRLELGDDVFFLQLVDIPPDSKTFDRKLLRDKIDRAKSRRKLVLALPMPPVLFSDDLDAIGRSPQVTSAKSWQGTPLSFGSFEGPALALEEPISPSEVEEGFVLVCPSTDPAWVPLFMKAGGLVMESGGVLSHGAIVAREFGIPAVAGIPNIQGQLRSGQRIHVDGASGEVSLIE